MRNGEDRDAMLGVGSWYADAIGPLGHLIAVGPQGVSAWHCLAWRRLLVANRVALLRPCLSRALVSLDTHGSSSALDLSE